MPANYNELGKDEQAGHWSSPDSAAMCSKLTCEFVTQTTPENAETTGRINKEPFKIMLISVAFILDRFYYQI